MHLTLISHIYNEEYLLPFWLEHHKNIFNHAIIIDYNSTDNSCKIIKEICPEWKIIKSRNIMFNAENVDREVMDVETKIQEYKIVLNVTEFLLVSKEFSLPKDLNCFRIPMLNAISSKENIYPEKLKDFFLGIEKISYTTGSIGRGTCRFLHNYDNGRYHIGRHLTELNVSSINIDAVIIWVGMYPWNAETIKRKLQIKSKIPDSDKDAGLGRQHFLDETEIKNIKNDILSNGTCFDDLKSTFKHLVNLYIQ